MTDTLDEVLTDPVGVVVGLVATVERHLDTDRIREVVGAVMGGRAGRRKLARALHDDPSLLRTGRPPAPYCVAKLLMALRAAGAQDVNLPRCGECGRAVAYVGSRRGGQWGCSPCFDKPTTCAGCGQVRRVVSRDRHGKARCATCPDSAGDPLAQLTELVTGLDPALDADTVLAALGRATVRPAGQRRLAWAVIAAPDLLTGEGHEASAPAVLRFIDELGRCGSNEGRQAGLPALPLGGSAVEAAGRQTDLPSLLRPPRRGAMRPMRRRARARRPRRRRPTAVSQLLDPRPGQPGGVCRLRAPQAGRRPSARRSALHQLPTENHHALRDLRPDGALRGLPGHRPALVRPLPAPMGDLQRLPRRRAGPQRHVGGTPVREVHQPGPGLLGPLPGLHDHLAAQPPPLPAVPARPAGTRAARGRHRHRPRRPCPVLPGAVRRAAP